jgi:surface antigen
MRGFLIILLMALTAFAPAARANSILDYRGECVPFARAVSGIQIWGNAWTWWDQAAGKYARGSRPQVGAVLVFAKTSQLQLGHVSVVSRIIDDRVIMVTHANWSRIGGIRGQVERDVTLYDVSAKGDWSAVKTWYHDNRGLGGSSYPVYGFIYGAPAAGAKVAAARPSPELTSAAPDFVGSLIDAYSR